MQSGGQGLLGNSPPLVLGGVGGGAVEDALGRETFLLTWMVWWPCCAAQVLARARWRTEPAQPVRGGRLCCDWSNWASVSCRKWAEMGDCVRNVCTGSAYGGPLSQVGVGTGQLPTTRGTVRADVDDRLQALVLEPFR